MDDNYYKNLCWNMTSSDNYILVNKTIAKELKDFDAAILLATLQFKHRILSVDDNGWFWFTRKEIEDNSFLSQYKQVKAEKILSEHNLLSTELREVKHKFAEYKVKIPFFKINYKQVIKFLSVEQKFLNDDKNLTDINNYNINNYNISSKEDIRPSDEGQNHFLIKRRDTSLKNTSLIDKKDKTIISYSPTKESLEIYSYWKGKGLKAYEEKYKGYVNDLQAIKKLLNGKCFNNNEFTQYKNHKFTNKEITLSIGRFALFALNSDYLPRDKKDWGKKTFVDFIYNSYRYVEGYGRSMFIYCLENNIKPIKEKDITVEDKYPILTKAIMKKYSQVILGCDNFEFPKMQENDFRKAAIFAQEFFKKNKGRLIGSYQELKPYKIAECLIEALMKSNPDMMRVQPYWLFNNIMQQKLPAYLYSTAIMKEKNSSSNSQENTFYNFGQPLG